MSLDSSKRLRKDWDLNRARPMAIRSFTKNEEEMPSWLQKPSSFVIVHVTYFIVILFIGSLAVWICPSKNSEHVSFIDALYCCTSGLCVTGLFSVRIQQLHKFQQTVILLLTELGSQIFTSLLALYARRLAYRRILTKQAMTILSKRPDNSISNESGATEAAVSESCIKVNLVSDEQDAIKDVANEKKNDASLIWSKTEATQNYNEVKSFTTEHGKTALRKLQKHQLIHINQKPLEMVKAIWKRYICHTDCLAALEQRVSQCCNTEEPRSHDNEFSLWESQYNQYMALTFLQRIVVAYFVMVQVVGIVLIQLYLVLSPSAGKILEENDVNKTFFAVYNCVTSFANAGFTLLDSSMVPFRDHAFILLILSCVILLGNTMFGPSIWVIISVKEKFARENEKKIYRYLLTNPRKCYTHLFPKKQTLWLIATVMSINTIQSFFLCVLDWNSNSLKGLNAAAKVVDAVFQTAATRNAGTNVVNLTDLSPPVLFLMVGMMYISVYPVYLTRQRTREFKQVAGGGDQKSEDTNINSYDNQISVQARKLLARDSAHLFIIVFLISLLESENIRQDPLNYSIFNIVFEVVSGFGNVGLSVGYSCTLAKSVNKSSFSSCQDVPYSLSGKWNTGGKILIVVTMFLGRHRSLPDGLDSALLLPRMAAHEEEFASCNHQFKAQEKVRTFTSWLRRSRDRTLQTLFTNQKTVVNGLQTPAHHLNGPSQPVEA